MIGERGSPLRVEFARVNEATDLARFVQRLGVAVKREGTTVEIPQAPADIERALTTWLAQWPAPLVPAGRSGQTLTLRPPAD
jgi:hypothetical protein